MEKYIKRDISKRLGEPLRTIQFWTDSGLVIPDVYSSGGKGVAKIYSERNLIEFKMIQIMKERCKAQLYIIREILEGLRAGEHKRGTIVISFKDFYENSEWGNKKELVYIVYGLAGPRGFHIVEKNRYGTYQEAGGIFTYPIKDFLSFTPFMLGNIKNAAIKEL
jgi:DNA-binding transcriptional MerR regulator